MASALRPTLSFAIATRISVSCGSSTRNTRAVSRMKRSRWDLNLPSAMRNSNSHQTEKVIPTIEVTNAVDMPLMRVRMPSIRFSVAAVGSISAKPIAIPTNVPRSPTAVNTPGNAFGSDPRFRPSTLATVKCSAGETVDVAAGGLPTLVPCRAAYNPFHEARSGRWFLNASGGESWPALGRAVSSSPACFLGSWAFARTSSPADFLLLSS